MSKNSHTPMPTVTPSAGPTSLGLRSLPNLPSLPSELLAMALRDLEVVEQSPYYEIDMSYFHRPDVKTRTCVVCLAGAVLARYLKPSETVQHPEGLFDEETTGKILAIDFMRSGAVRAAVRATGHSARSDLKDRKVPRYEDDPEGFRRAMARMVEDLQCVSL